MSRRLFVIKLKRDTSSAKTEEITSGKSSSQSNLNELAEQFKTKTGNHAAI